MWSCLLLQALVALLCEGREGSGIARPGPGDSRRPAGSPRMRGEMRCASPLFENPHVPAPHTRLTETVNPDHPSPHASHARRGPLKGGRSITSPDVDVAAGAPVLAGVAGEEPLVDQVPAQRGVV